MATKNLVLRTMYIDPDVDDQLRTEAFDNRTSKNDLLRKYLRLGMEAAKHGAVRDAAAPGTAPQGAARKSAARKAVLTPDPARAPEASKPAGKAPALRAAGRAASGAASGRGKTVSKQAVSS